MTDDPEQAGSAAARLRAALLRYDETGDPKALDDAVTWGRRALDAASGDSASRASYAGNLATILLERYERDLSRADLDEALALFEWAVPAIERAGGQAATAWHSQGQALLDRYQADYDVAALDQAIEVLRKAAADATAQRAVAGGYLNTLGQALRAKAEAASDLLVLDEAVRVLRRAREWTTGSDDHVAALASLGNALLDRAETGPPEPDLEDSVACLEEAIALAAAGTSLWGRLASNLGNALVALFRSTGRRAALLRARALFEEAAPALGDPADRAVALSNLAACLEELYEQTGENSFLDEAIAVFRGTVNDPAEPGVPERRQNFGVCLLTRFRRYQSPADLDQAIDQFQAAARDAPTGSVIRAAATNSLGNALSLRFGLPGHDDDLTAAISAYQEAVRGARENSVDRALYRANLGVSLMERGELSHSAADVDAAIREQETAVAEVPAASQEHIRVVAGLADSLSTRGALTGSGSDAARARDAYRTATAAGLQRLPEQAVGSATNWGMWAISRGSFAEAAEALGYGLRALEQLSRVQVTRLQKESWLRDIREIPVHAAYALVRTGDLTGASAALERGRGILLSEALQRDRAGLERLAAAGRADLADRYEAAASRWNQLSRAADAQAGNLR
jgi:hypothetical protein